MQVYRLLKQPLLHLEISASEIDPAVWVRVGPDMRLQPWVDAARGPGVAFPDQLPMRHNSIRDASGMGMAQTQ